MKNSRIIYLHHPQRVRVPKAVPQVEDVSVRFVLISDVLQTRGVRSSSAERADPAHQSRGQAADDECSTENEPESRGERIHEGKDPLLRRLLCHDEDVAKILVRLGEVDHLITFVINC